MLFRHCLIELFQRMALSWAGVISAAVLLPPFHFKAQRRQALAQLAELHSRIEALGVCRLDISTLSVDSPRTLYDSLYPINALRNLALDQASTVLVFLLDVDFEVSSGLYTALQDSYQTIQNAALHCRWLGMWSLLN